MWLFTFYDYGHCGGFFLLLKGFLESHLMRYILLYFDAIILFLKLGQIIIIFKL